MNVGEDSNDKIESAEIVSEIAKSFKCDECEKLFGSSEEVEYHAVKSGHSSFSESSEEKKTLTDEERKQKVKDLEEKLRSRRIEKEEQLRKEVVEREKKRIQMSREIAETKRRIAEKEMKQLADEKRREKMEDKLARQKVKEQIEKDKLARKEMFPQLGISGSVTSVPSGKEITNVGSSQNSTDTQKKEYDTAKLQIRLPTGPPLIQEFKAKESLSCVRLWISLNRKDKPDCGTSFKICTMFPRQTFTEEDMDKPLNILGLTPSAVLLVNDN